jgi:large subunit ribosomal protein L6
MSRIGRKPISIPQNVKVSIKDKKVEIQGPNGTNKLELIDGIICELKDNLLYVKVKEGASVSKAQYGTMRAHLANAVRGVVEGFYKELEVVGVGYRCQLQGNTMSFVLGYVHPREIKIPDGIKIIFDEKNKNKFKIWGIDKHQVGQLAAIIRSFKEPDVYKGKGIRYTDEIIKLKPGKVAGAK